MKKFIFLFFLINVLWSQQISIADLNKISNNQLDQIRNELQTQNQVDNSSIENQNTFRPIQIQPELEVENDDEYFGYEYFNQEINFFDNIPTPLDFRLGPGDEVVLSLWGETNQRKTYLLDKNGMLFFENIGFINISNKTIDEAEILLVEELSKIYSTLKDKNNSTELKLELGKIRSINVYFTGQVLKPGINLIHPFSDVFSALVQAGGINNSGSLRKITLIRDGKIIETIDFYSFFTSGFGEFQKIRIIDGDIIHIPPVNNRIQLSGEINKPKFYEALDSDKLTNLIEYAGGLKSTSSSKALIENIIPIDKRLSDDSAKSGTVVDLRLSENLTLSDGAKVTFLSIANNDYTVKVFGRVVNPGDYPVYHSISSSQNQQILRNVSLKELLDLAGGFNDPVFRKTINDNIVVLRMDENQFYSKEFNISYTSEAENFLLEVNDNIFVYESSNYNNDFKYYLSGEVNKPGVYPLKEDLTLAQAIALANGVSKFGSINSVSVTKTLESIDSDGNVIQNNQLVRNIDLDYKLSNGDEVTILPKTNVIRVNGNVYSPGLIGYQKEGIAMSVKKAIELAGGYKPHSLKKRCYVVRANGEIEQVGFFRGGAKRVFPGDSVFVPLNPNPQDFDLTVFIADLSATLANIAAILLIADNN